MQTQSPRQMTPMAEFKLKEQNEDKVDTSNNAVENDIELNFTNITCMNLWLELLCDTNNIDNNNVCETEPNHVAEISSQNDNFIEIGKDTFQKMSSPLLNLPLTNNL